MVETLRQEKINLIVVKPPIPARVYQMLPNESQFDTALKLLLDRHHIEFHDFSLTSNDEKFFFNTDHLNRMGVLNFFELDLKAILAK